jgi:hypothetical protein
VPALLIRDTSDGSVTPSDMTLLMLSVDSKSRYNPFVVRALCEAGGHDYIMKTCAQTGRTALHFAVAQGREEAAQPELMLREFGGEELGLKQDHIGRTFLHLASEAEPHQDASRARGRSGIAHGDMQRKLRRSCNTVKRS